MALRSTTAREQQQILGQESNARYSKGLPMLLLLLYAGLMIGLTRVADNWIVALAITPLVFALLLTLGCLLAYRRDFYA